MKKQFCVLLIAILCAHLSPVHAQLPGEIRAVFLSHQQGVATYQEIKNLFQQHDPSLILDQCVNYLNAEAEADRQLAVKLIYKVAKGAHEERTRHNATYQLVNKGLRDPSSAVVFRTLSFLENLPLNCFDVKTQNSLAGTISSDPPHFKSMIRLSGRLQMHQLIPFYTSKLTNDSTLNRSVKWNLHLTLGRMGDPEQVAYCIDQVARIGMNDEVIYRLLPDLIYLKHKLVIDYLLDQLVIENSNCTSADPDQEAAIDCGYRLAEVVAPFILDFPIPVDGSGDLDTDNYEQALQTIRHWVESNRLDYQVRFED